MTLRGVIPKDHEGNVSNPNGQLSSGSLAWLNGLRSPASDPKVAPNKGNMTQFTLSPGNLKALDMGEKSLKHFQPFSKQSASPEYPGHTELGYGQSLICGKHPYLDPCYGLFSTYGPPIMGRIMLPLELTAGVGPIYVNAKQYHGIIRRRISRAKAEAVNKVVKVRKPYLHLSRHLHAMRRPRGCGGRFLNTKTPISQNGTEAEKAGCGQFSLSIHSQNSGVLHSDSGNLNSPAEENGMKPNLSGTEVTGIFSTVNIDRLSSNRLSSFVHPPSEMMNTRYGLTMSGNWV